MYIQFQFFETTEVQVLDKAAQTSTILSTVAIPSEDLMRTCTGMDVRKVYF